MASYYAPFASFPVAVTCFFILSDSDSSGVVLPSTYSARWAVCPSFLELSATSATLLACFRLAMGSTPGTILYVSKYKKMTMVPREWVRSVQGTSSMQGARPVLYGLLVSSDAAAGNDLSTSLGSSTLVQFDSIVFGFHVFVSLLFLDCYGDGSFLLARLFVAIRGLSGLGTGVLGAGSYVVRGGMWKELVVGGAGGLVWAFGTFLGVFFDACCPICVRGIFGFTLCRRNIGAG